MLSRAYYVVSPWQPLHTRAPRLFRLLLTSRGGGGCDRVWEVEEKFSVHGQEQADTEQKLVELGFVYRNQHTFTDWYLDAENFHWPLLRQDCWLRFRKQQNEDGVWQLKIGKLVRGSDDGDRKATVYEEVDGDEALQKAVSIIRQTNGRDTNQTFGIVDRCKEYEFDQPKNSSEVLNTSSLVPFARLTTTRTSWIRSTDDSCGEVCIDLDTTDFGYAVGEVEICVNKEEAVEAARREVKDVIEAIESSKESTTLSKLETYLVKNRPDVHKVGKENGIL